MNPRALDSRWFDCLSVWSHGFPCWELACHKAKAPGRPSAFVLERVNSLWVVLLSFRRAPMRRAYQKCGRAHNQSRPLSEFTEGYRNSLTARDTTRLHAP